MSKQAFAALALMAGSMLGSDAALGDDERTFEKRQAADPRGIVEISNFAGAVNVRGWDRAEIQVNATMEEDVERVDFVTEGRRTRIKVVLPRGSHRDIDGEVHLEIMLPQDSELDVSTVSADIESNDVNGRQRLKSVSGNVSTELAASDVELKTVSGDAVLRGRGKPSSVRASTVSGNLTLNGGAGELDATTVSGDLIVELEPASDVRVRTTSGNLRLSGQLTAGAEVSAETVSGELYARLSGSGFDYEVTTFSGDIETCFRQKAERVSEYGPGLRLAGKHGDGKAIVRMKTMSGDVELCGR